MFPLNRRGFLGLATGWLASIGARFAPTVIEQAKATVAPVALPVPQTGSGNDGDQPPAAGYVTIKRPPIARQAHPMPPGFIMPSLVRRQIEIEKAETEHKVHFPVVLDDK